MKTKYDRMEHKMGKSYYCFLSPTTVCIISASLTLSQQEGSESMKDLKRRLLV